MGAADDPAQPCSNRARSAVAPSGGAARGVAGCPCPPVTRSRQQRKPASGQLQPTVDSRATRPAGLPAAAAAVGPRESSHELSRTVRRRAVLAARDGYGTTLAVTRVVEPALDPQQQVLARFVSGQSLLDLGRQWWGRYAQPAVARRRQYLDRGDHPGELIVRHLGAPCIERPSSRTAASPGRRSVFTATCA